MLDFAFTAEQELFRRTVRDFAEKELRPLYARWDQTGEFPRELYAKAARLGLTGLLLPVEYGGQGADCVTTGIALEAVARGDFNLCPPLLNAALLGGIIAAHGTEEQKRRWLPPLAAGEETIGLGLTEPGAGSDAAAITTRALRQGDHYILRGEKTSITLGGVADVFIVYAKTQPEAGARGVSSFIVPRDSPGLSFTVFRDLGSRLTQRGSMAMDDTPVPAQNLLGQENRGFYQIMHGFEYSRAIIGLFCLGAAQAALEDAIAYARQRYAFGRPIGQFQGVAFPIAEDHTLIEAARLLCYKTLWLRDQNLPHTKEAAMCKWWAPKVAVDAIHHSLLIHGHYGYSEDFPQAQRLRDVIGMEIGDGTAEISKLVVARALLGQQFLR